MVRPPGYCLGNLSSLLQPDPGSGPRPPRVEGQSRGVVVLGVNWVLRELGSASPTRKQEAGTAKTKLHQHPV